ncbi:MAG: SHOCT domain-containing protein [Bacteroidota bacterium]|nr:SHOCT domain-containing protein [Bacteroidota bacterium]
MKKLLLILLCFPMIGLGQNEIKKEQETTKKEQQTTKKDFNLENTIRNIFKKKGTKKEQETTKKEQEITNNPSSIKVTKHAGTVIDNNDGNKYDNLRKLGVLRDDGILTEEEFQKEKKKILESE